MAHRVMLLPSVRVSQTYARLVGGVVASCERTQSIWCYGCRGCDFFLGLEAALALLLAALCSCGYGKGRGLGLGVCAATLLVTV